MSSQTAGRMAPAATRRARAWNDWRQAIAMVPLWTSLAMEDLRDRYRRTALGVMWITISFGLFVLVKIVVFGQLAPTDTREFALFVTLGFGVWTFMSAMVNDACTAYMHARTWILGTSLPYPVYLLQVVYRNWLSFGMVMLVMLLALVFKPTRLAWSALSVFPALLAYFVASLWVATALSSLCVRYRDLYHTVQTSMRLFFFITPILWVPGKGILGTLAAVNPFTHFVAIIRDPLLYDTIPATSWLVVIAINLVGIGLAAWAYASTRNRLAYWV